MIISITFTSMMLMTIFYILIVICATNITPFTSTMMMATFYRWVMTLQAVWPPQLNLAHRWTLEIEKNN